MTQNEKQSAVMDIIEYLQTEYLADFTGDHCDHLGATEAEVDEIASMAYDALAKAYHSV